jgi:hypothetical protein
MIRLESGGRRKALRSSAVLLAAKETHRRKAAARIREGKNLGKRVTNTSPLLVTIRTGRYFFNAPRLERF